MALKYRVYSTGNDYSITTVVTGLTLERIVHKIGGPIAEEQVWALCHQCCVSLSNSEQFLMRHITAKNTVLTIEGEIKLLSASGQTENNRTIGKALSDIGQMLFTLLDYGLDENVERTIAPSLEKLIEMLLISQFTNTDWSDDITDDCTDSDTESMRDSKSPLSENSNGSFAHSPTEDISSVVKVGESPLQICRYHIENVADPFLYYQNICISLIEEVIDLINLNRRFSSSVNEEERKKRETNWCCVMSDIKNGVKLKHVATLKENDALVLSDLEKFLISVTKFTKASLKPVMQYGSPSRRPSLPFKPLNAMKEVDGGNTHDSIMKGILSKPKLKPVSDRVNYSLTSNEVTLSPREMLMNDIQRSRRLRKVHRSSLKRILCCHDKSQSLSCMPSAIMAEQEDSSNIYNSLQPNSHLTLTDMQPLSVSYSGRDEFETIAPYNNDPNDLCHDLQSPLPPLINSIVTSNGIAFIETKLPDGDDSNLSFDWSQDDNVFSIEDRIPPPPCLNGYTSPFNVTGNDGNCHGSIVCQKQPSSFENHQNGHGNIMNSVDQKYLTKQVSVSMNTLSSPGHYISNSFSRLLLRTRSKRLKQDKFKQFHYYTSNWSLNKNKMQYEERDNLESDSSCKLSQEYIFASNSVDNEEIVSKNEDIELLDYSSMPLSDIISIQSTLANTTLHNIELTDNKLYRDLDTGKLCFQCHKKFRFMSQPHICYICQRKVCVNCLVKDISSIKFSYLRPSKKIIEVCASCKNFLKISQLR